MNEAIFMNKANAIETDLSREGDGYEHLLNDIRASFEQIVETRVPLFTTDTDKLYDLFLDNLPEDARQHYTCRACENFVNRYGGLVTIDDDGKAWPVMWRISSNNAMFFRDAVYVLYNHVQNAKVTGVFITSEKRLGIPKTGAWTHMAVTTPRHMIHNPRLYSADQVMAEKKEAFKMLMYASSKYKKETVETAVNLLRSNSLYRGEKILGIAEWFLELKQHRGSRLFNNIAWKTVATAPAGFCHISSSVIGSLLDDIEAGMDFEAVKRRFDEKMNPVKYQRPQVAPGAQNVARAEQIVAKLGIANSLKRRYARLDELQTVWKPRAEESKINGGVFGSVFAGIKTKEDATKRDPIVGNGGTMTWEKFQRTVLPTAKKIELKLDYGRDGFAALVTAVDPEAPPIIKWDTDENRNPFSWYLYSGGSYARDWNLQSGSHVEVTGVVLQPNLWQPGYEYQGKGVFFILKGCKDKQNKTSALFPELLRGELHEVRATIEAYSKVNRLEGDWDADACGLCYQSSSTNWQCNIRVTTDVGVSLYKLDRWD